MRDTTAAPSLDAAVDVRPGAIVLGGAHGALAVIRSLGRHGVPVCVIATDTPITRLSRYATHVRTLPGRPNDPGALAALLALAGRGKDPDLSGWLLFTGGDVEAEFVAHHHAELAAVFRVVGPDWSIARFAVDKRLSYQRAEELGIAYPRSRYPRSREDIEALDLRFPVILKPTVGTSRQAFSPAKAWRADDRDTLLSRFESASSLVSVDGIVVQEFIPGDGSTQFSYAGAWQNGTPLASLVARRTRQYPREFGYTSTFVETIEEPKVTAETERFLASLNFTGLVEVEFKFDAREQRFKLLDVNARAWTWMALAAASGVDLPWLVYRATLGEAAPLSLGHPGATWRYLLRDIVVLLSQVPGRPRLRRASANDGPKASAAYASDDPLPAVADLFLTARHVLRNRVPAILGARRRRTIAAPTRSPETPKQEL